MLLNLVNRISSERKLKTILESKFEYSQGPLGDVTSRECPESTSQGRHLNNRLRHPLDVISGRPLDVRLGRPWDGQIRSLGDVLGMLEGDIIGTSWGPIFAGWVYPWKIVLARDGVGNSSEKGKKQMGERRIGSPQPAWDVSEMSQSDRHWERHLKDFSETSQKRRLFCYVFEVSEYSFKQNKNVLKIMTVLLYTYF